MVEVLSSGGCDGDGFVHLWWWSFYSAGDWCGDKKKTLLILPFKTKSTDRIHNVFSRFYYDTYNILYSTVPITSQSSSALSLQIAPSYTITTNVFHHCKVSEICSFPSTLQSWTKGILSSSWMAASRPRTHPRLSKIFFNNIAFHEQWCNGSNFKCFCAIPIILWTCNPVFSKVKYFVMQIQRHVLLGTTYTKYMLIEQRALLRIQFSTYNFQWKMNNKKNL